MIANVTGFTTTTETNTTDNGNVHNDDPGEVFIIIIIVILAVCCIYKAYTDKNWCNESPSSDSGARRRAQCRQAARGQGPLAGIV